MRGVRVVSGELANTGSETTSMVEIALALVLAGLALLLAPMWKPARGRYSA